MAKYKCLICKKSSLEEYCFKHKSYKKEKEEESLWELYFEIWSERPHYSQLSGFPLGKEPKSYMFDHLLEKSLYPQLKYEKENILLVTAAEHEEKYLNPHPSYKAAIENAIQRFLKTKSNEITRSQKENLGFNE